jgi:hypothetical protein
MIHKFPGHQTVIQHLIKNRRKTIHNSQISGTSTDMNIPIVINDYSIKKEPDEESSQQIQENKLEQQRKLGREHSKECRGRKRLSSIKTFEHAICDTQIPGPSNGNPPLGIKKEPDEESSQQIQQDKLERQRKLARERSKKYRDRKRLSSITSIKTFEHAIHDEQMPGPSNGDSPLVIKNRRITIHNSQIPRTSTDMNIPIVINDYSGKSVPNEQSNRQIQQNKLERQRKLAAERCKKYRDRKRLSRITSVKTVEHAIHDTQISGPSNANPPLVIKKEPDEESSHNSQIPGRSADMNIPIGINDYSVKKEPDEESSEQIQSSVISIITVEHAIHDTQIPGPSNTNPPLVIKKEPDEESSHKSQFPGTSTDMNIPIVDYSVKKESDEESSQQNKVERQRKLARERSKKYRDRKRLSKQSNQQIHQNKLERRRKLARERSQKYRDGKRLSKQSNQQTQQNKLERRRKLAKERSQKYRDRKRLSNITSIKTFEHAICDTQVPGPSNGNPPLVIKKEPDDSSHNSQIPGTSRDMNIPIAINDYSGKVHDSKNNCAGPSREGNLVIQANQENYLFPPDEENRQIIIDDNLAPLEDQAHASSIPNSQSYKSSTTYSSYTRHSSAHIEFHKQFTHNSFGHACKICDRLWFKNDLKNLNDENIKFVMTFLPNIDKHSIAVCLTCRTSIQKKSIPQMAVYNGFEYPIIPNNLLNYPLDLVSERLISPRIPFMQIRRLRNIHGQCGIYGQIINVPVEVNTMVNSLPRNINDDHCIYVHIKRKKIHKSSLLHRLVNKRTVKEWLHYLVNTPLYRTYDITIDEQLFNNLYGDGVDAENYTENDSDKRDENYRNELTEDIPIEESLLAQQQTVMCNDDLFLRIAPGENNVPISLLFDEHAEELSFPSIYLGQFRQFREGVTVTPFMMVTSELRRSDRRGVTPHHLLYMAMKIMRIRVKESVKVTSKHVGKHSNFTKQQLESEDYIHNCIEGNLAFLRSIPNSTWYWSERKKDLFAMIRQLGKPTVFFTISANEIGWPDLLQLLYKLNKHDCVTKEAVAKLHFMVKSTLITEDAVTCAIYFNKLVNVIMNILQSKKCSPFRKFRVLHYFKRIEFHHQGSPQAHILAWLDNAPKDALNEDYDKAIELIDALTSVSASEASGNIKLQTHKHTLTCYKKLTSNKAQKCRFEAPFMPCKKTMILNRMKDAEEGFVSYRKRYTQIRARLENEDFVDMEDFYSRNHINSDEEYCNIIRAGITRPKVFVKREPFEKWHNPFNPFILNIVKSNTDFQFITEEYSCAAYVVEYVNKTNKGVSHLQRKIIETMNEHPEFDIVEITKNISANILNHTEITSQEAAWYLLRETISKTSVGIVYIPTVRPTERQRIRKTIEELSKVEDDCSDVWKENWFDKYEKRPEYLEDITLAQFVSKYLKNRNGEFIERKEPRIIRYRNYDMASDFNEYKREMVTLHLPFRSEEEEILAEMKFVSIYDDNEDIILQRRKEFESNIDIGRIIQICRQLCQEETPLDENET